MPGRQYSATTAYRYGFNGQEKSTEIDPNGSSYTAEFWQYDARIVRRWNVDPVFKEYESPYAAFANNPIWITDVNGADTLPVFRGNAATLNAELKNKNISPWLDLLNFSPSPHTVEEMRNRSGLESAYVQDIGWAKNDPTNFDYYSLNITKLPGDGFDLQTLFQMLRFNFEEFVTGSSSFAAYNPRERKMWESSNPIGAVMSFDENFGLWQVLGDDASVLTSANYSDINGAYWNFSTLYTPLGDWGHPVSGTRQFGVSVNSNTDGSKSYTFFTRGVDRVTDKITKLGGLLSSEYIFQKANSTWVRVMNNINNYINEHGGKSEINEVVSQRLSWDKDVRSKYTSPLPEGY